MHSSNLNGTNLPFKLLAEIIELFSAGIKVFKHLCLSLIIHLLSFLMRIDFSESRIMEKWNVLFELRLMNDLQSQLHVLKLEIES